MSQFSTVKYIHIIVTQISRTFSSCKTETLYPLNDSFFLPLPCHISGITVVQQHPWHSVCRRNSTAPRKCTCCVGYRCAVCSASIPPSAEPLPLDCDLHVLCYSLYPLTLPSLHPNQFIPQRISFSSLGSHILNKTMFLLRSEKVLFS